MKIRAVAKVQGEGFKPSRVQAELAHEVIGHEENRPAVDAAGKADADGRLDAQLSPLAPVLSLSERLPRLTGEVQPPGDFVRQRADVTAADFIEVGRQCVALWREEAPAGRLGIRTANELDFDEVMRRNHARVGGMKLVVEAFGLELSVNGVDAVGDDERRAFLPFGQEI